MFKLIRRSTITSYISLVLIEKRVFRDIEKLKNKKNYIEKQPSPGY